MSEPRQEWTREQQLNAMKYGVCHCGAPREQKTETDDAGRVVALNIVCPKGHS